jgi:hypothetical protein
MHGGIFMVSRFLTLPPREFRPCGRAYVASRLPIIRTCACCACHISSPMLVKSKCEAWIPACHRHRLLVKVTYEPICNAGRSSKSPNGILSV